jgi:4-amino-4-deoxy-L-arabinose transferase-like glycosyltransferase
MSPRRELMLLVVACVVAYGTGLGDVPFYTRGEPREGLVVREMHRTGAWLVPQRPEGEIARKPPLYYWLAAPVARVLPDAPELALRIPSAVLGTAAVVTLWATAHAIGAAPAAFPAALVLATTFEWTRAATSARIDMTLAASLVLVLSAWLLVLAGRSRRWLGLAAGGAALATLAKGPVGLAVPGLVALAYAAWRRDRSVLRRLGLVPVLGTAIGVAGLWYAAAFAQQGGAFLDVVLKENLVRFVDTDDARLGHAHGVLYLPLLGLVGLLPWTPFLPFATPSRRDDALALAGVWALVVLVFFSVANAKRSVYLLPALPALALCVGAGVAAGDRPWARRLAAAYLPALVLLGAVALAFATGLDPGGLLHRWLKPDDAHGATAVAGAAARQAPFMAILGIVTLAGAVAIDRSRRAGAWLGVVVGVATLMVLWTAAFDAVIHPAIAGTRSLEAFMARVDRLAPPDAPLYVTYPADPGLRFYAPRTLLRFRADDHEATRHVLLWEDEWRRLRDARGTSLDVLAVSDARQSRRGHLSLVLAPPGKLQRMPEPGVKKRNDPEAPAPPTIHPPDE